MSKKDLLDNTENIPIDNLQEGVRFFNEGKYLRAINMLFPLLEGENSDYVRQYLARCFFRLEEYQVAYSHFEELLKSDQYREYAASMLATIDCILGDGQRALRVIKKLPPTQTNLISQVYILYYIYRETRKESLLDEAETIISKISTYDLSDSYKTRYYLACGMIRQARKEYPFSLSNYKTALSYTQLDAYKASIYDEIGSLYIDMNDLQNAEIYLMQAYNILSIGNSVEKGINLKMLGILEKIKGNYNKAKEYFLEAIKILNEKETYYEAREVQCLLLGFKHDQQFYEEATQFSVLQQFHSGFEEVTKHNEKIIDIIDRSSDDNNNDSNVIRPDLAR